jgi:cell division protease FtsH
MSSVRRVGSRSVGSDKSPVSKTKEPLDPAVVVAIEMLARAPTGVTGASVAIGSPSSVTVVHTPSCDWTELLRVAWAWAAMIHDGAKAADEDSNGWWGTEPWIAFVRAEKKVERVGHRTADEAVANALWRGMAVTGFSHDPDTLLPCDLVQGADHRLEVTSPTPGDVAKAVKLMTGGKSSIRLTESEVAGLAPRMLRLARRPGQTADDYVSKLRDILARERASAAEAAQATPRDEPTLDRLHGMDEAIAWGLDVVSDLEGYMAGKLSWSHVSGHACLLSGPPGCGKTLFARALAASCGVPLVTGSYGQWLGSGGGHQGSMLKGMRDTFGEARRRKPSILFIDEVDSFPNRATLRHAWADWEIQVVNALLAEIDGVEGREGVILVAACNHPEMLDPALVRSGRLDRHIRVRLPDRAGLERIFREHLGSDLAGVPLSGAALVATGASGVDVERFVRGARRRAREAGRPMVVADLMDEIGGADDRSEEELERVAIHEAGHAVAMCELHPGALRAVTVRPNGGVSGAMASSMSDSFLLADDVHRRLVFFLAGRAAEQVVLGAPSSGSGGGAESDIACATRLAATAVASLGLDGTAGPLWSGVPSPANLPEMLATNSALAARVRTALEAAYSDAIILIGKRRAAVDALTAALMEQRALDGDEAAGIVAEHPATSAEEHAP